MALVLKLPHSPLSASTRCIWPAYGRAFMMRSCARRSFDAATIFMAFVICCVFLTARIRRRRSISDGISRRGRLSRREIAREFLDRPVEHALQLLVELLALDDAAEDLGIPRVDERIQLGLEGAHLGERDGVQVPAPAGIDERGRPLGRA